jgi:phosphoribosyl 1,2-cyclic phosphodiesterase
MRIRVLASGSGGNAYVLEHDGRQLLLEAGIRYQDLQRGLGHGVSRLDACLVSHEHGDHGKGAARVAAAGVDVYATAGTLAGLGLTGHRAHALAPLVPTQAGVWRVLAFPAIHDAAEPSGFLIGAGDDLLLYVTDSAFCPYRFEGLTHVMVEANYSMEILQRNLEGGRLPASHMARVIRNHLSIERCVELLRANDLSRVQEIHLLHMSNSNSDAAAFKRRVERATGRPVRVAEERTAA